MTADPRNPIPDPRVRLANVGWLLLFVGVVLLGMGVIHAMGDTVEITHEGGATPYAVVDHDAHVLSRHTREDKAIEAAINRSAIDGLAYYVVRDGRLRVLVLPQPPIDDPESGGMIDDDGSRTPVSDLKVQSGKTYRNLTIRGGVRVVGEAIHDVTFENCDFVDASMHLTLYDVRGWTFRNCTFRGATRLPGDWGHSHGAFMSGVDNFLFEDCTFERNGWLNGQRFNQNHNVYFDRNVGTVTFRRTKFIEAAAQGVKMRGFQKLVFEDCEFRGNLIDLGGDDRSPAGELIVKNCRFIDTGGTDSIGLTLAWSVNLEYRSNPLGKVTISDCTWIGPGVAEGPGWSGAIALHVVGSGIGGVTLERPDFRGWQERSGSYWSEAIRNKIGDRLEIQLPGVSQ